MLTEQYLDALEEWAMSLMRKWAPKVMELLKQIDPDDQAMRESLALLGDKRKKTASV